MLRLFTAIVLGATLSALASTQPKGSDRLRELVVFPEMNLSFNLGMSCLGDESVINRNTDLVYEISQVREEAKHQPSNTRLLMRLGDMLDKNGETDQSTVCYQKAEQFCRAQTANRPHDGLALTDLGAALGNLQKKDEAENVYRKAVLVSSNEWKCWMRLGNFLASQSFGLLYSTNSPAKIDPQSSPQGALEVMGYLQPTAETIKKSDSLINEASRCFEKAVSLDPKNSELFFQRAGFMLVSNWQHIVVQHFCNGENFDPIAWACCKGQIADLEKASDLDPKNYEYISLAAYFTLMSSMAGANSTDFTVDMMPDKSRQLVRNAMTRLEALSENPDKKSAAGALEKLGLLNFYLKNFTAAKGNLRRAVALDPSLEQSWDILLGIIHESGSPEEVVSLCQSRLKSKNSARNHLLLAKSYVHQKKWNEAGFEAINAGKLETNNIVPPLMLTAISLKQSSDTNQFILATENLGRASEILKSMSDDKEKQIRWREITLNLAILFGLDGTQDSLERSRNCLKAVLARNPDDEDAKMILSALN